MKCNLRFLYYWSPTVIFALYVCPILGEDNLYEGLPAAFGDFNSDKLTDLLVIQEYGHRFEIVRQQVYSDFMEFSTTPGLRCSMSKDSKEMIVGLIPSDFTGNAMMDILLITKNSSMPISASESFSLRLLKGNKLKIDCDPLKHEPFAEELSHQPLLLDLNGDSISDILAQNLNGTYLVWYGSKHGMSAPETFPLNKKHKSSASLKIRNPNSNAFVDISGDHVADIFLDGYDSFEYWYAGLLGYTEQSLSAKYPKGQDMYRSSFADINGDVIIDHIIPFCSKNNSSTCGISAFNKTSKSFEILLDSVKIHSDKYIFKEVTELNFVKLPISLRFGDINGDGYPDIITVMYPFGAQKNASALVLFENVPTNSNSFGRTFEPRIYANTSNISPMIAAFFDLKEDARIDVLFAGTRFNGRHDEMQIGAFKNTEFVNANFLKILITSGLCPGSCYDDDELLRTYKVPYGTNKAGPFVSYWLNDANNARVTSGSGQLSQSSDFSLQMPYTVFGLGKYANYIEEIKITVPSGNTTTIYSRVWDQMVPDSQIVIVPHPIDKPSNWERRLFLKPSQLMFKVGYTLLAICVGLFIIIAILHRREHLKDLAELEDFKQVMPGRRR